MRPTTGLNSPRVRPLVGHQTGGCDRYARIRGLTAVSARRKNRRLGTVAVDHYKHFRVGFTIRTWRDLGRSIQQRLSTTVSVVYSFSEVR